MNAVAYCRYSSNNQREESIEAQLRAIQDYCKKENITLLNTYIDQGKSATNDNRPSFIDMIHDSSKRAFEIVLVHKLDRFARNRYDSAFYRKKLKDNGVKLISILEQFDDSPESIILESVLEGMSEYYSKNLAREVLKGMNENALNGIHNGGIPLIGYDVIDGKYVINESEAAIVRKIFNLYTSDCGYLRIAKILNSEGYKTKRGKDFQITGIQKIIQNIRFTGVYKFRDIIVEGGFPQIIDKNTFEIAQLKTHAKKPRLVETDMTYLLTGYLECGECGYHYAGGGWNRIKGELVYRYTCGSRQGKVGKCENPKINKDNIEKLVIDTIKKELLTESSIEVIANHISNKIKSRANTSGSSLKKMIKEKKELENKLNKLFDLYLDDKINKDMISSKSDDLRLKLDRIEFEIKNNEYDNKSLSVENIKEYLRNNRDKLDQKSDVLKRQLIESFIEKVVIYKSNVVIYAKVGDKLHNGSPLYSLTLEYIRVSGKIKSPV